MKLDSRLDGHIVQGHIDQTAECTSFKKFNLWLNLNIETKI